MGSVESGQIRAFLEELGRRYSNPAELVLIGGSALCLLGSPRPTLDIDYVGDDLNKDDLQQVMEQIAREMNLWMWRQFPFSVLYLCQKRKNAAYRWAVLVKLMFP